MNSGETKTYDSGYTSVLAREDGPKVTDSSVVYTSKSINYNIFVLREGKGNVSPCSRPHGPREGVEV